MDEREWTTGVTIEEIEKRVAALAEGRWKLHPGGIYKEILKRRAEAISKRIEAPTEEEWSLFEAILQIEWEDF